MLKEWRTQLGARIAASPLLSALQDEDASPRARRVKAVVLVACGLLHLGFYALLAPQINDAPGTVPMRVPERSIEVVFIERKRSDLPALPPLRRAERLRTPRSLRAVRIDPPPAREPSPVAREDEAIPDMLPSGSDLLRQIPGFAERQRDDSNLGVRNPMRPLEPRLPGSAIAVVEGIRLRREITPEDMVKAVGGYLFGARETCPDVLGKMHDATIANPTSYSNAERRDLAESERHCRYR